MKIALFNTYSHGGAGTAARRLQAALQQARADAPLFFRREKDWRFYAEALSFWPFERDPAARWQFSQGRFGQNFSKNVGVADADILHLHWTNQGFLSLSGLKKLAQLGKPIVWTLHDMWAFTGGCHYSGGCQNFKAQCGDCSFLKAPSASDLSHQIWLKKNRIFKGLDIQFVACSRWLAEVAKSSALLAGRDVRPIPNPIDTSVFRPLSSNEIAAERARLGIEPHQKILLFAAMKIADERKGFAFLKTALKKLSSQVAENQLVILVLGQSGEAESAALPYPTRRLGLVSEVEKLRLAYGLADVFAIPSLEDNLPNTVMESLACGTPVVGFETGGVPEMVEHLQNGFIAPQRDAEKLAAGIFWCLENEDRLSILKENARKKAVSAYSNAVVAARYLSLYAEALAR